MSLPVIMRMRLGRALTFALAGVLFVLPTIIARAHPPSPKVSEMFPLELGGYHQLPSMRPLVTLSKEGPLDPNYFAPTSGAIDASPFLGGETEYLSARGDKFLVEIVRVPNDSSAYSLFTLVAKRNRENGKPTDLRTAGAGTSSFF